MDAPKVKDDPILDTKRNDELNTADSADTFYFNQGQPVSQENIQQSVPNLHQSVIIPQTVKQRHIQGLIIFTGLAANRPSGKTEAQAYWATDTHVWSLWTGTAWKSVTLS